MDFKPSYVLLFLMIGFLLRKTLYDLWDNMLKIVMLNLGFLASVAFPIFIPSLLANSTGISMLEPVLTVIGFIFCCIYLSTASYTIKSISDYGTFTFGNFIRNIKLAWSAGFVMGILLIILFFPMFPGVENGEMTIKSVAAIILGFYMELNPPLLGLALTAIIFWALIFAFLSFQFYFTVYARLGSKIKKSFKKCMLIALDNTGLAVFMVINNLIALVISVIFAFMFPGPVGILLYLDEALRLRLLKYDWLEANPGANRKKIPWDELLIEERERTGRRTFKNFIFPWKD